MGWEDRRAIQVASLTAKDLGGWTLVRNRALVFGIPRARAVVSARIHRFKSFGNRRTGLKMVISKLASFGRGIPLWKQKWKGKNQSNWQERNRCNPQNAHPTLFPRQAGPLSKRSLL